MQFTTASTALDRIVHRIADAHDGWRPRVSIARARVAAVAPHSEFDVQAPGILVFAILMLIPWTAMALTREIETGTLRRLRMTPLHSGELFAGVTAAMMVLAALQIALMLGLGTALGWAPAGSLLIAFVVCLALAFSAVGVGLVLACVLGNDSQASNVGGGVMMLQVLLSGCFFPMPVPALFTLAGHEIGAFDVFPATHGFLAMQQVLAYGGDLGTAGFRLAATFVVSALWFAVGVWLFERFRMRA